MPIFKTWFPKNFLCYYIPIIYLANVLFVSWTYSIHFSIKPIGSIFYTGPFLQIAWYNAHHNNFMTWELSLLYLRKLRHIYGR